MTRRFAFVLAPAVLVLTASLFSYGTGALPGTIGLNGVIPLDVTRGVPGCAGNAPGPCHNAFPGGNQLRIDCVPTKRSLVPAEAISVTTIATGGVIHPMNWGGFVAETTRGTFSAGVNSQVSANGAFITHLLASTDVGRRWTYGLTAASTPGPFQLYTVSNTVNGDGNPTGDQWGFYGINPSFNANVPVQMYVNAPNVTAIGSSCAGAFGYVPVLGAGTAPTVGNAQFAIDLRGATAGTPLTLLLSANPNWVPIDLTFLGITGCALAVDPLLSFNAAASTGDIQRAEGNAAFPLPIPADPTLRNLQIQVQCVILDAFVSRPVRITLTNGLRITVQ